MLKKILISIVVLLLIGLGVWKIFFSGDTIKDKIENVSENLNSYNLEANMELINGEEKRNFVVKVSYQKKDNNDLFRVSLYDTNVNQEQIMLRNNEGVYVLTPSLNQSYSFKSGWPLNSAKPYIYQSLLEVFNGDYEIKKLDDSLLVGQAPEVLRHFMEIRGLGIIDVKSLYGVGATKTSKMIDLVIHLEGWDENKYYDRLGLDKEYEQILGVSIEKLVVPVKPGRNTAMVLEVAAMNYRQRGMGYDSAHEFTKKLSQLIDNK